MNITVLSDALAASLGVAVGGVVAVPDRHGVPLESFWRNRVRDSEHDGCVRVEQTTQKRGGAKNADSTT